MTTLEAIDSLKHRMNQSIIGQEHIVERLIIGLLSNGNLLVEGLPGLAKTRAVKSMANAIESEFSRHANYNDLTKHQKERVHRKEKELIRNSCRSDAL